MLSVSVLDLMVHMPVVSSAVPVPIRVVPWYRLTVAPRLALPLNVGVVTVVMLSAKPLSLATKVEASATKADAPGALGPSVSMVMVRLAIEVVPSVLTCVALTTRLWLSPPKAVRWLDVKTAVVQLPLVAVTGVKLTLAPLTWLVKVTLTVAPLVAVPLMAGSDSVPSRISSPAMVLMTTDVLGAKEVSMVMLRTVGLETTPPTVWRTLTAMLPMPKVAISAVVK